VSTTRLTPAETIRRRWQIYLYRRALIHREVGGQTEARACGTEYIYIYIYIYNRVGRFMCCACGHVSNQICKLQILFTSPMTLRVQSSAPVAAELAVPYWSHHRGTNLIRLRQILLLLLLLRAWDAVSHRANIIFIIALETYCAYCLTVAPPCGQWPLDRAKQKLLIALGFRPKLLVSAAVIVVPATSLELAVFVQWCRTQVQFLRTRTRLEPLAVWESGLGDPKARLHSSWSPN